MKLPIARERAETELNSIRQETALSIQNARAQAKNEQGKTTEDVINSKKNSRRANSSHPRRKRLPTYLKSEKTPSLKKKKLLLTLLKHVEK
ncbi:MAG: hypothetical protein HC912_12570 [Saprospiraceae bacterium]|nr:hypothetical protein [Saprospiraceae bacterium]